MNEDNDNRCKKCGYKLYPIRDCVCDERLKEIVKELEPYEVDPYAEPEVANRRRHSE